MKLKTILSILTLSVVLPTASAGTTYGCWSDASAKFHENCVVAIETLLVSLVGVNQRTWLNIPSWTVTGYYGNCAASIRTTSGSSVPIEYVQASFNQLVSRCQNGYFYYDSGWLDANVRGHAGWKRDELGNTTDASDTSDANPNPDFPHGGILQWEDSISPQASPLPQEFLSHFTGSTVNSTTETEQKERQHARDLTARAPPGVWLWSYFMTNDNIEYSLWRGAQVVADYGAINYQVRLGLTDRIGPLLTHAAQLFEGPTLNIGFAVDEGVTINALAMAVQLARRGPQGSWHEFFQYLGDNSIDRLRDFMVRAIFDLQDHQFVGGVYHIYNGAGTLVVTFILNSVRGQYSQLPSH